jgi:hypothetical protein
MQLYITITVPTNCYATKLLCVSSRENVSSAGGHVGRALDWRHLLGVRPSWRRARRGRDHPRRCLSSLVKTATALSQRTRTISPMFMAAAVAASWARGANGRLRHRRRAARPRVRPCAMKSGFDTADVPRSRCATPTSDRSASERARFLLRRSLHMVGVPHHHGLMVPNANGEWWFLAGHDGGGRLLPRLGFNLPSTCIPKSNALDHAF